MILKRKNRYILVESSEDVDSKTISLPLFNEIVAFLGEAQYSSASPRIIAQYNRRMFVIRVNRGFERHLILALSFIKEASGRRMGFYTLKTSGTMKTLGEYARIYGLN